MGKPATVTIMIKKPTITDAQSSVVLKIFFVFVTEKSIKGWSNI